MTCALTVTRAANVSTELAAQIDRAANRRNDAQSPATKKRYATAWAQYALWAAAHGATLADPLALATWLNVLAEAGSKVASVNVARAAVIDRLRADGNAFDARNDDLRRVTSGIKRAFAATQRTVLPIEGADVQAILALEGAGMGLLRDKAMIALAFGHGLRGPSELLALDYAKRGTGNGHIELTSAGVQIELASSKASQERGETLCVAVAVVRRAVAEWINAAGIKPGSPLFVGLRKGGALTSGRLSDTGMLQAVQRRMIEVLMTRGASHAEAVEMAKRYGTHSMRKGVATSMARAGESVHAIMQVTRHKSLSEVQKYVVLGGVATKPVAALLGE